MALERRSFIFFGLEYATVIWEMPSSSIVSCSVASTIDLTAFLGMSFLLYSMWMNSLLGLLEVFCGAGLVVYGVRQVAGEGMIWKDKAGNHRENGTATCACKKGTRHATRCTVKRRTGRYSTKCILRSRHAVTHTY